MILFLKKIFSKPAADESVDGKRQIGFVVCVFLRLMNVALVLYENTMEEDMLCQSVNSVESNCDDNKRVIRA